MRQTMSGSKSDIHPIRSFSSRYNTLQDTGGYDLQAVLPGWLVYQRIGDRGQPLNTAAGMGRGA